MERAPYKIRGPNVWARVRAEYLAGETVAVVAERWGVGVHNVKRRANKERWTRRAWAEANDLPPLAQQGLPPAPSPEALLAAAAEAAADESGAGSAAEAVERATARAMQALAGGRIAEATAAAKLAEIFGRLAATPGDDERREPVINPGAPDVFELLRRRMEALGKEKPA